MSMQEEEKRDNQVRQVILVRTDLNMSVGKLAIQVSHASKMNLLQHMRKYTTSDNTTIIHTEYGKGSYMSEWLDGVDGGDGIFTGICLEVKSEQKLLNLVKKAEDADIITTVITDVGKTEFNGVKTITCACLGLASKEDLDKITGRLRLLK